MATTSKKTIYLQGQPIYNEDGAAGEAITPGMLVKGVSTITKHATADAVCPVQIALEMREMNQSIVDAYAIGDTVRVGAFKPGARFLGIISSGVSVSEGDFLASAGDGTLKSGTAANAIATARETIAAATTGFTRIICEAM